MRHRVHLLRKVKVSWSFLIYNHFLKNDLFIYHHLSFFQCIVYRTDDLAKHSFFFVLFFFSSIIYMYVYISTKKKERRSMAAGGYLLLFLLLLEDNKLPKFPIIQLFILSHLVFFLSPLSLDSFILYFRYLMYVCNVYIDSFRLANRHRPLDKMNSVHSCVSVRPKG